MSDTTERGFLRRVTRVGGVDRRYVVYVPDAYDPESPSPAILFLHGRGEEGTDGWAQAAVGLGPAIMLAPERWPCLVVFPQKPEDASGWLEYETLALDALRRTREEWSVDPSRIYLTGVSLGGFGSWLLAPRHRDLFAAIAPVCGGGDPTDAAALVGLPIWAFHGDDDPVVSVRWSERMVGAVRAAGGDPRLTTYPGVGHNSWDAAYRQGELPEWLLSQSL
jgi:predicted peptidase